MIEAVASIQEDEPVEIVVVDDHSDDEATRAATERLAADGVKVLRLAHNQGPGAARNAGLAATSARFVFPLDADDLAAPGALAHMADRLEQAPAAVACFGDFAEFGDVDAVRHVPLRLDPYRIAYTNEYPVSSLFRRSALEEVGGWTTREEAHLEGYEDWDLWMTLAERGAEGVHAGEEFISYRRRIHGTRLLQSSKRRHPVLYRSLRGRHTKLFSELRRHRRATDVGWRRRLLYPVVYGRRPRFAFEPQLRDLLARARIWTPRR